MPFAIALALTSAQQESLTYFFVVYMAGLLIVPALPKGRFRNLIGKVYAPMVYLGLWYRWSMYAPEAPTTTRIALPGALYGDGTFEPTPLHGLDGPGRFGQALGLRMVAFQWSLYGAGTDYLKPSLCEYARRRHPKRTSPNGNSEQPIAFEVRRYDYPSPPPGAGKGASEPTIKTVYSTADADRR